MLTADFKRALVERGGTAAGEAGRELVPICRVRELEKQIRDLHRLVGKQAMTIEILRPRPRVGSFYRRAEDRKALLEIKAVVRKRTSSWMRRVHRLANRTRRAHGQTPYNCKRIRQIMPMLKLSLPEKIRRRDRPHTGQVRMLDSNQRCCSNGFNIRWWNGELVSVAFALNCHDREALDYVAQARALNGQHLRLLLDKALWSSFGEPSLKTPAVIEWLSDNGGPSASFETMS